MSINLGTVSIENNTVGRLFANKKGSSMAVFGPRWHSNGSFLVCAEACTDDGSERRSMPLSTH